MRLFVSDVPQPFLSRRTILVQGNEEPCFDPKDLLDSSDLPGQPRPDAGRWTIPEFLSLVCEQKIEQALSQEKKKAVHVYDRKAIALRKPIESSSKVIIVGQRDPMNRSQGGTAAKMATGFLKFASALADPGTKVPLPMSDGVFDADAVLGVVIGKRAERIAISESLSCVAGFTLLADITDRNAFLEECQTNNNLLAKNRPGLSPLGPCIRIRTNEPFDPIEVTLKLNGKVRQQFTLEDLAYGVEEMISVWSRMILEPGDIIGLGATIAKPQSGKSLDSPVPVKPGDLLEVESPAIGLLRAEFVES